MIRHYIIIYHRLLYIVVKQACVIIFVIGYRSQTAKRRFPPTELGGLLLFQVKEFKYIDEQSGMDRRTRSSFDVIGPLLWSIIMNGPNRKAYQISINYR